MPRRVGPLHHVWDLTPADAVELQRGLARDVVTRDDDLGAIERVAGTDVGFEQGGDVTRAAVAVLSFPGLELIEQAVVREPTRFPYVPGLLSFREAPALLAALNALRREPDVLLCDGQGLAHPRRFGLACHMGLLSGLPAIGVAKTRLIGSHGAIPQGRGEWTALRHREEVVGAVLRTRAGVKPVYVSVGHRISLGTALRVVMACTTRFRLPETTRHAHRLASGPRS